METLLSLDYGSRLLLSWGSAIALAVLVRYVRNTQWHRAVALGLMTVPLWLTAWNFVNSIQVLADPNSRIPTYSTWILSGLWSRSVLVDLGYVGAGVLLLASGGHLRKLASLSPRAIARVLQREGLPLRGTEAGSIAVGLLAFPIFLAVTWVVNWLVYSQPALVTGDETSVWADMTSYHTILISLSAGIGEEVVYRGVLLVALLRIMPPWVAVSVQSLLFGFAHAGYGTLAHVIVPTLFGLVAGVATLRFGIWSAITLHVLVDVAAFGIHAAGNEPWFGTVLATLLLANALATFWWAGRWTWQRVRTARPS